MKKIVIIGAGVVGATIAYELSRTDGLEISLIEGKKPGEGATGAALGVLMGAISRKTRGRAWEMRRRGLLRYETLVPELESLTGISIPFNRQGIALFFFTDDERGAWQDLVRIRREQGWELQLWDRERSRENCPGVGYDRVAGAIYSPGDRQVNPTELTRALVAGAARNGAICRFGEKVENLESEGVNGSNSRRCRRIHTSVASSGVDLLILCAGIGSRSLTGQLARPLEIRPVIGQALQVKLARPIGREDFQPVLTADDVQVVPLGKGEYWLGATVEFAGAGEAGLLEEVRRKAIALCPALAGGEIARAWRGERPRPSGRPAPVIERLEGYDNVILATGHYRNGILLAPATAALVREMVLEC
jgi:glycine/D-amino acid oxidase-like deaminating enzyme